MNETERTDILAQLVGQVGEVEGDLGDLVDEHQVTQARLVALEARCTRTEAVVQQLRLRADEDGREVDRLGKKLATLDDAVAAHLGLDVDARD